MTEPQQGATYDDLLAVARTAEELGFDAFFRSDHYLAWAPTDCPGPTDAWVTLAGLARDTSTIRLGTLMTSRDLPAARARWRSRSPQVDQMSGGRVELGLGAGWFEAEHTAYGIPFPGTRRAVRPVRGAARDHHRPVGDPAGGDVQLRRDALPAQRLARPCRSRSRARGPPVTRSAAWASGVRPTLAATYADEFNLPFVSLDDDPAPVRAGRGRPARTPAATPTTSSGPTR